MRTKAEIADILTQRKTRDIFDNAAWSDLVSAIQALTQSERNGLLRNIVHGQDKQVTRTLRGALKAYAKNIAASEVTAMLADDSLTLEEIDSIL